MISNVVQWNKFSAGLFDEDLFFVPHFKYEIEQIWYLYHHVAFDEKIKAL